MEHNIIWNTIDRLAKINHTTCSGLARRSGLDPTIFNKSKRVSPEGKLHYPSLVSVLKILSATDMTLCDFAQIMNDIRHDNG